MIEFTHGNHKGIFPLLYFLSLFISPAGECILGLAFSFHLVSGVCDTACRPMLAERVRHHRRYADFHMVTLVLVSLVRIILHRCRVQDGARIYATGMYTRLRSGNGRRWRRGVENAFATHSPLTGLAHLQVYSLSSRVTLRISGAKMPPEPNFFSLNLSTACHIFNIRRALRLVETSFPTGGASILAV